MLTNPIARAVTAAVMLVLLLVVLAAAVQPAPHLDATFIRLFVLGLACQLALWGGLVAICGRTFGPSVLWTLVAAVIVIVNNIKFHYTETVILPVDLFAVSGIVTDFRTFVAYLGYHLAEASILVLLAGVATAVCWRETNVFGGWRRGLRRRAAYVGVLVWGLLPLASAEAPIQRVFAAAGATVSEADPRLSVVQAGLFMHLLVAAPGFFPDLPAVYGDDRPFRDYYRAVSPAAPPELAAPDTLPDIVVVLAESLFDPRRLRLEVEPEPLRVLDRLSAEARVSGTLGVHTVGGGTVRAEYSFLTGIPTSLLGQAGRWPFHSLVTESTWSIPRYLHARGYRTVAVYPVDGSLFNARPAYRLLGFDEIVDRWSFEGPEETRGPIVRDAAIAERVRQIVDDSDEPVFVMALTMDTHGPWSFERARTPRRYRVASPLSPERVDVIEGYLHRLPSVEQLAASLIDHLESQARPFVFALFGDHLPAMSDLFDDVGFRPDAPTRGRPRFETPYFVTTNVAGTLARARRSIDIGLLGSLVLDAAGVNGDEFFGMSGAYRDLCDGSFDSCPRGEHYRRSYVQILYDELADGLTRDRLQGHVMARSLIPEYRVGDLLRPGSEHYGAGWAPESWGVWSVDRSAFVNLHMAESPSEALEITARVRPFRTVDEATISVNGQLVDTWSFGADESERTRVAVVPADLVRDDGYVRIRFDVRTPASPRALGLGWDTRTLGIALSDLRVARHGSLRVGARLQ